ncbi:MAG: AAA family ATPase [Chromatiaceae bacterium]|nr:AAA family ATPase [Chromatiaceae bacterium]
MNPQEYIQQGWALVPIPKGQKGPNSTGWSTREKCVTDAAQLVRINGGNVGLAHAYSRTCAIDIDDYEAAKDWLDMRCIDLDSLLAADDAVQITSGKPNRAKLIYKLPEGVDPLPQHKVTGPKSGNDVIDFRCGTAEKTTVQDVLPPSIHPETGKPYEWRGDWRKLPTLPGALLTVWRELIGGASGPIVDVKVPDDWVPVALDALGLKGHTRRLIIEGDAKGKHKSRSHAIYGAIKDLIRAGCDDATICRVMVDSDNAISEQTLERCKGDMTRGMQRIGKQLAKLRGEVAAEPKSHNLGGGLAPISARDLYARHFDPLHWNIQGILPAGTMLLFGKPKKGKSFLTLLIAISVAAGRPVFGKESSGRPVLYLGLEDSERRAQRRLKGCASALQIPPDAFIDKLHFSPTSKRIDTGLIEELRDWMKAHPDTGLIVIDMLKKVTGAEDNRKSLYNQQAEVGDALTKFSHEWPSLTLLVVHHSRKAESDDPFDLVSGTTGLSGSYDQLIAISDATGSRMLHISGREVEAIDIPLRMTPGGMYTLEGVTTEDLQTEDMSDTRRKVFDAVPRGQPYRRADVIAGCKLPEGIVDQHLIRLIKSGLVRKAARGMYQKTGKRWFDEPAGNLEGFL